MRVLEFFCGTKSISNVFEENGHETFTLDNNPKFEPSLCIDFLKFDLSMLPKQFLKPDVVWASPPCTTFSVASLQHYWTNHKPKTWKTYIGLALAKKTFELIEEIKPKFWFVENPRGMLRKQDFIKKYHRKTVTYCQYGDFRQKPTDIWTNAINWNPKPMCKPGDPCHQSAPRGAKSTGTQSLHGNESRSIIPKGLCDEIVRLCETTVPGSQTKLKGWAFA